MKTVVRPNVSFISLEADAQSMEEKGSVDQCTWLDMQYPMMMIMPSRTRVSRYIQHFWSDANYYNSVF